ncbi:MAG: phosphate acyltransferase PlsX [Rikenellaceae bacterium]|nr:phosphate acyltransferase PlsX [Rikenellaceae bacterium]MBO7342884.1 phosphate acyltransferase PlsX [Alistipes sp.]
MLKIGIDAMGGDFAPEVAVEGAVMALKKIGKDSRIVLFGDEKRIRALLKKHKCAAENFDIVATTEVIEMGDHPAKAFIAKKDSSMTVGFRYLAEGKIDGFASAGSTGAMMVGCMQVVKPIEGVIRPVISTFIPIVKNRRGLLLDVGLNVDAKPEVLSQYGLLGSIYAEAVLGIDKPRVALLNIGEEEGKGNAQAKAAYDLLKEQKGINFVGNVESSYIFTGKYCDVVVSDGFVGNVVLKMAEALYRINTRLTPFKPWLLNLLRPVLEPMCEKLYYHQNFWNAMNYESVGGTIVIGVNAPVMIGHGGSSAKAICSLIKTMERNIESRVCDKLREALKVYAPVEEA